MARLTPEQLAHATALQQLACTLREIAAELGISVEAVTMGLYGDNADWTTRLGTAEIIPQRPLAAPIPPATREVPPAAQAEAAGGPAAVSQDTGAAAAGLPSTLSPSPSGTGSGSGAGQALDDRQPVGGVTPAAPWIAPEGGKAPPLFYPPQVDLQRRRAAQAAIDAELEADAARITQEEDLDDDPATDSREPAVVDGAADDHGPEPAAAPAAEAEADAADPDDEPRATAGRVNLHRYNLVCELGEFLHRSERGYAKVERDRWSGTTKDIGQLFKKHPHLKAIVDQVRAR